MALGFVLDGFPRFIMVFGQGAGKQYTLTHKHPKPAAAADCSSMV